MNARTAPPAPGELSGGDIHALLEAAAHDGCAHVSAPDSLDAATALVDLLNAQAGDHEVRLVAPDGARWTVDEVVTQILEPARFGSPDRRRHIVVADAANARAIAHDRLLKTLEEPLTGTTVWLVCQGQAELPSTLAGRATRHAVLAGTTWQEKVDWLRGSGVADVAPLLRAAGGDVKLAWVAHRFGLTGALANFGATYGSLPAHTHGGRFLAAAASLAVAVHHTRTTPPALPVGRGDDPVADLKKLNPTHRTTLRRLVRRAFDAWEQQVLDQLILRPDGVNDVAAALAAIERGRRGLDYNTPYQTLILAALHPSR